MVNSETGASTSNMLGGEYQVFLNFRGPDTRSEFTTSLHQALVRDGIHVFIDDEELRPGERISSNLERAIDNSKLYIPIFSKKYASSHWCLHELARMVANTSKSKEDDKKVILPIFYDVKPNDVKLETELYKKDISELGQQMEDQKNKFSSEDIETWRQALQEVGGTKGCGPKNDLGELIQEVVAEVVVRLRIRERQVTEDLLGMGDRIVAINNLLDIGSDSVRSIGIYGIGGIGKTALANIIFNQLWPRFGRNCSFLENVREMAKSDCLVKLQEKLLRDISGEAYKILDIDHGINMIGETICNKKTLIVLDDVDAASQVQKLIGHKSLYPGTRILVTTRDKSVLNIRGFKYKIEEYEMVQLSDEDAIKLFSRHAFDSDSPPDNYYTLSGMIVSTADGLPLALKEIGSSLHGRKRGIWEECPKKLKERPHKNVLAKLRTSYDALERNEQEIFLDIACYLVGENKTNPMYVWKDCEFYPKAAIEVLINKCMIKELDDNSLWMHKQFIDLGRTIAKEEGTRLWHEDDIKRELKSREIKDKIHALCLKPTHSEPPIIVTSEQINRFPHIRFLLLREVICQGDFTCCLSELKWISLDFNHKPPAHRQWFEETNLLHLENVAVVNLSGVDITKDVFKSLIKGARKLKVLTFCYNTSIHGTLTFPGNSSLEKLTISKFFSLKEIDCSIGKLTKLIDLSFESCVKLEKLPEEIGRLRKLQHLSLRWCGKLRELPDSILKLTSLTKLDVLGTRISKLPGSIETTDSEDTGDALRKRLRLASIDTIS